MNGSRGTTTDSLTPEQRQKLVRKRAALGLGPSDVYLGFDLVWDGGDWIVRSRDDGFRKGVRRLKG